MHVIILYVIIYYVLYCVRGRSSAVIESLSPARLNLTRETGVQHLDKPTKALEQGPNLQLLQVCSSLRN